MSDDSPHYNGKRIAIYDPPSGSATAVDIKKFLRRFKVYEALRLIGGLTCNDLIKRSPNFVLHDVPISDGVLAYLAMQLIESSNDYRSHTMTTQDIAQAADLYWGLPEPRDLSDQSEACLIRQSLVQFDYQRQIRNWVPRTLLLYGEMWPVGDIDVDAAIQEIYGTTLEKLIIVIQAYMGRCIETKGFIRSYGDESLNSEKLRNFFTADVQSRILRHISTTYSEFRSLSSKNADELPNPTYERYRFNPLRRYPAIRPDRDPLPGAGQVYIVPVVRHLFERVTEGIYHELSTYFREGKPESREAFRINFGKSFEKYVGFLLKGIFPPEAVCGEITYKSREGEKKSPDWIILHDDALILIEAKQSCLYLPPKLWGIDEEIRRSIRQTLAKGVRQLFNFETDLNSHHYPEIERLSKYRSIHRLIVTYDNICCSNSVLRRMTVQELAKDGLSLPNDFHWHTITIEELESLLGMHRDTLPSILQMKRDDSELDSFDFGDLMGNLYPSLPWNHPKLDDIREGFFERVEIQLR